VLQNYICKKQYAIPNNWYICREIPAKITINGDALKLNEVLFQRYDAAGNIKHSVTEHNKTFRNTFVTQ
jgi:hypothetical protein